MGIQPDISVGRTLAQAIQYFSLRVADDDQDIPLRKLSDVCMPCKVSRHQPMTSKWTGERACIAGILGQPGPG